MFHSLLFAGVAGVGVSAANVPAQDLTARGNAPPSYGAPRPPPSYGSPAYSCSASNQKCAQAKQQSPVRAYCSSFLHIPTVKTTKGVKTVVKHTQTTVTSFTTTVLAPASTVTKTITSCAAPAVTAAPSRRDLPSEELERRGSAFKKPSCLPNDNKSVSAACSCLSIKPATTTVYASTTTLTSFSTSVVKTATTKTPTPVTKFTLDPTGFLVGNDQGYFLNEQCGSPKEIQSGTGNVRFEDDATEAILFQLNASGNFVALEGTFVGGLATEQTSPERDSRVLVGATAGEGITLTPLVCSVSQPADGTCPLACQVTQGDVSQGDGENSPWYLGPANSVSDVTYKTFAVSRSDSSVRGGCRSSGRGRRRK